MDYKVTDSELTGIANAIRTKGGTSSPLVFPNGFSNAIDDIPSGSSATLVTKSISQNGTYNASSDNADGYSQVVVSVSGGSIYLASLSVTTPPTQTTYDVGDTLDLTGCIVTATYSNGATKDVTSDCTFSPDDGDTLSNAGTQTISISYTEDGVSKTASTTVTVQSALTIVPFSSGTDAEIVAMLNAAHNGTIDLHDDGNWNVGDSRLIDISAFTAGGVSFPAQQMYIVISKFGDYDISCGSVMQFDFKSCINPKVSMNADNVDGYSDGGYANSVIKTTLLPALVNALPSWLKNSLIEFSCLCYPARNQTGMQTVTGNKLALRAYGGLSNYNGDNAGHEEETLAPYYSQGVYNRAKPLTPSGSIYDGVVWWLRSTNGRSNNPGEYFCSIGSSHPYKDHTSYSYSQLGVSPFGCL